MQPRAAYARAPVWMVAGSCIETGGFSAAWRLIEAARTGSPRLKDLIARGLPGLHGRDGAAVWGQEFLFAVESDTAASVSIDKQAPVAMTGIPGTKFWYPLS